MGGKFVWTWPPKTRSAGFVKTLKKAIWGWVTSSMNSNKN